MEKWVYSFIEGNREMKALLGGKGANLAEMKSIGLPVPSGFTITTKACNEYLAKGSELWEGLKSEIFRHLHDLEERAGKKFGDELNPLLVSVRSGSAISMPGMMDTILNLGLNDQSVIGLAKETGNDWFAYDSYRRFIQMYADVVLKIDKYKFDIIFDRVKNENGVDEDTKLSTENLMQIVKEYKNLVLKENRSPFPEEPKDQLLIAVEAVFNSWMNPRAEIYRKINNIPDDMGTAVNIQEMVFGNMGNTSGTGVAFTRNPSTGEKKLYGEYLLNAQGEDVVAGTRTPKDIIELKDKMPRVFEEFVNVCDQLEEHYKDMQDIEFTIEKEKLFILQTRTGKRTAASAVKIAVDLVDEGKITEQEAVMKVEPDQIEQLLHPTFDPEMLEQAEQITQGLPASSGAASGQVYFTSEGATEAKERGEDVILVRTETSPEDIEGMVACKGILTARGGMTSHAAVVARGMGKCCIAGASDIRVNEKEGYFIAGEQRFKKGDFISLDGNKGNVYKGKIQTEKPELSGDFSKFMSWVDQFRVLKVRTNADTPKDTKQAIDFGAEGIGLCRTEHMFFEEGRISVVRNMILSREVEDRIRALDKLLPMQRSDFKEIFEAMGSRPVTIRLLDPPLHEFLPEEKEDIKKLAKEMDISVAHLHSVIEDLGEVNPMLGHRGCRLAVTYPEIYKMQVRAIMEAVVELKNEQNLEVIPEIMVPLVGELKELQYVKQLIIATINEVLMESQTTAKYLIGTMIEVPRAAVTADKIAEEAEFFSFGTNDLTQMAFGFSRDDAGRFIKEYQEKKILEKDPFQQIDRPGVGKLMEIAVDLGKKTREDLKLGICGEHGGEASSVEFCHLLKLDYVSCSPYRVPVARLAAAQAALRFPKHK
ncbi:pyruvate, phosphate dikinase [Isachenkonia alkalipeptolytica]|uniref:Pyruvate, phosphate dikinase n=1 Tax=Isachenkonia alkalipeptolytica TaxID=2565777 RepID=A0AA43XLM2_9CLOT|nr:pyruvate, phosphate dikinase [Isachenkonia alkalipeptolytica]NBG88494.1 pyruvate, phosphate dikinase [Isachenkonia alkalipeptolytica]